MHKLFRFLYLNTYSFLLLIGGLIVIMVPLYRFSLLLLIPQIIVFFLFIHSSIRLFSTWKDKKIKYDILMGKNKNQFRAESFEVFMKAPCGRLLTKSVLKDLGIAEKYRELLIYKEPFISSVHEGCKEQKTRIYINKVFL